MKTLRMVKNLVHQPEWIVPAGGKGAREVNSHFEGATEFIG